MILTEQAALPLTGRRLFLRVLTADDAEELFQAVEHSRGQLQRRLRWVSEIRSVRDEEAFVRETTKATERKEAAVWGFFETRSRRLSGVVALDQIVCGDASASLGVWTHSGLLDRGYATEAARLVVEYGFRKLSMHRLYARIDPTNRAMRKVLKKLGFYYEGCLRDDKKINGRWVDQECWGLIKTEWKRGAG